MLPSLLIALVMTIILIAVVSPLIGAMFKWAIIGRYKAGTNEVSI
jgi:hypothetical protein